MATESAVRGASRRPAANVEAPVLRAMRLELAGDDVGEVGALPIAARQHSCARARQQPAREGLAGAWGASVAAQRLRRHRLHRRERVLDPVVELVMRSR